MTAADGASSISVAIRVRPFTVRSEAFSQLNCILTCYKVREAAQLTHVPEGPLFLGDGSLAGAPTPKPTSKGIRPVLKVIDDKCLYDDLMRQDSYAITNRIQSI